MNPLNSSITIESVVEKHSNEPWAIRLGGKDAFAKDPLIFMMRALVEQGMNNPELSAYQSKEAYPGYILERIATINKKDELIKRLTIIINERVCHNPQRNEILAIFNRSLQAPPFQKRLDKAIYYIERTEFTGCVYADRSFRAAFDVIRQAENLAIYVDPI